MCWGIKRGVAEFILQGVGHGSTSLETGCGISTLVFAIGKSSHTAITPNRSEIEAVSRYALSHSISLDSVNFVNEASETYLPKVMESEPLDFVLVDGRHAFPWPAIDYFYASPRIRNDGIIVVDDIMIPSVKVLVDFLAKDANWTLIREFPRRALAFKKIGNELDVEWNFQRYNLNYWKKIGGNPTLISRAVRKLRRKTG